MVSVALSSQGLPADTELQELYYSYGPEQGRSEKLNSCISCLMKNNIFASADGDNQQLI